MVLLIHETSQFRRDIRRLKRQGKDMKALLTIITLLVEQKELPAPYRNHHLTGNWKGYQECHIRPDWLLIYKQEHQTLYLVRSGSHSDLF